MREQLKQNQFDLLKKEVSSHSKKSPDKTKTETAKEPNKDLKDAK